MDTRAKTSQCHEHGTHARPRRTPPLASLSSSPTRILLLPLLVLTTLASLARAASSDSAPTLNLPHIPTTCDILNLTWTGGTANYTLQIIQELATVPLQTWTALANTSVLWTVNVCGGKDVSLTLTDAGGYKSAVSFAVQYGADGSCLSQSQRDVVGCIISASGTSSAKSTSTAKSGTSTGTNKANSPRLAVVVGVMVGVGVLMLLFALCLFRRRRQRRGTGVLGPGSRPYFVRHERDPARRRDTLLEMPPPMYQDALENAADEQAPDHDRTSNSHSHASSSPPLSAADHDPTRPLMHMPEPQTIQMAQLPSGRIEPELLPTPFLSSYEGSHSATTPSSEGPGPGPVHAREHTSASHPSGAGSEVRLNEAGRGGAHEGGVGGDEPPPPYTLTA
ncbi:hypothetical protein GSI_04765 [Ganoderma sinense ZZ0214-1]|uniref:Uncharacterized protein n=1 Tax=Ganoderma sinense ZZ0214-1 TaxID=1077348 RepID=A0A2G8SHR0_9APHY|nr:hypothetical protein GSI_04765 [Ganoderma sinense ZZ0214-1]